MSQNNSVQFLRNSLVIQNHVVRQVETATGMHLEMKLHAVQCRPDRGKVDEVIPSCVVVVGGETEEG